MNKKVITVCKGYGIVRYGMTLPIGAVYGTTKTEKIPWVCVDPNFYPDGKSIDILIYDNRKERRIREKLSKVTVGSDEYWKLTARLDVVISAQRWKRVRIDCGEIYNVLIPFLEKNNLFGQEMTYGIKYKGTYQSSAPHGKKHKMTCLKQANKEHLARYDMPGVTVGRTGGVYTKGKFHSAKVTI